jgi:hypothetical protein
MAGNQRRSVLNSRVAEIDYHTRYPNCCEGNLESALAISNRWSLAQLTCWWWLAKREVAQHRSTWSRCGNLLLEFHFTNLQAWRGNDIVFTIHKLAKHLCIRANTQGTLIAIQNLEVSVVLFLGNDPDLVLEIVRRGHTKGHRSFKPSRIQACLLLWVFPPLLWRECDRILIGNMEHWQHAIPGVVPFCWQFSSSNYG